MRRLLPTHHGAAGHGRMALGRAARTRGARRARYGILSRRSATLSRAVQARSGTIRGRIREEIGPVFVFAGLVQAWPGHPRLRAPERNSGKARASVSWQKRLAWRDAGSI